MKNKLFFIALFVLLLMPIAFAEDIRSYGEAFTFNNATGSGLNITGINGTVLTVIGSPTLTNGKLINGTNFGGGSSAFNATISAIQTNFSGSDDSKTVSIWVQPSATSASTICSGGAPGISTISNYLSGSPSANNYLCQVSGGYAYNREHPGDSNNQIKTYQTVDTSNYHHLVFTWNATYNSTHGQQKLYYDGALVNSSTVLKRHVRAGSGFNTEIGRNAGGSYFSGKLDIPIFYNYAIGASDVTYLYNAGAGIEPPFSSSVANLSIIAKDFYTGTSLNNFSACILSVCYNTTTGSISTPYLSNHTSLLNITVNSSENGGYFNQTYINYNASGLVLTANISQSAITFDGYELMTNNNLSGVSFSTTYLTNDTHYMRAGTYTLTASKSGYLNKTISITINPYDVLVYNVTAIANHTLNITVIANISGSTITSYTLTLTNSTFSYSNTTSVSSSPYLANITTAQYLVDISAPGYYSTSNYRTYSGVGSNNTYYLYPIGGLTVRFIDQDTGAVINTTTSTITFQNSTTSLNYSVTNGLRNITGLADSTYNVLCQSPGYSNTSYVLTYSSASIPDTFTCIMPLVTNDVTFQIQSPDLTPLANVLVYVEQFVNGTMNNIASEYTDGTGQAVLRLTNGRYTRVTLSLDGYLTQTNTNNLDATTYTYTLDLVNRFDPNNSAGSDVIYSFYPTQMDLNLTEWYFELNVTPVNVLLEYFKIEFRDENNTYINSINSTVSTGGRIVFPLNVTPYNQTTLRVYYSFKKQNYTNYTALVLYNVRDTYYTGTIAEVRTYVIANFTLGERLFLWLFITVVSAVLLYQFGIRDLLNVLTTSALWLGLAYVFGMNMFIVGFVFFILVLVILRYTL